MSVCCRTTASLAERTVTYAHGMSDEMTYAHLGRSGLMVSRIGLGTMNFGYTVDESSSFAVMDAAIDAGINFFDTADVYGGPQSPDMKKGYGIAEETVGRWLQRSGRRDDIVLATKVYQPMGLGPNDRRLSAYHIRRACEASLRRLQTDHIDLYQMHHVDRATPWEEIWQAMEQLVREGKISYVGSSNFAAWDVALAQSRRLGTALPGPDLRAEPVQPRRANRGAGADPRAAQPRHRPDPVQPAPRRPARRRARSRHRGTHLRRLDAAAHRGAPRPARSLRRAVPGVGREAGGRGAGLAAAQPCRLHHDRRSDDDRGAAGRTSARCRCSWTPRSWNDSTRSGRGRGKPRRRTPGKADPRYLPRALARLTRQEAATREPFWEPDGTNGPLPTSTLTTVEGGLEH